MSFIYNSKTGNIKDRGLAELYTEQTVVLNSAKKLAVYICCYFKNEFIIYVYKLYRKMKK
jgi:hypothetical protein